MGQNESYSTKDSSLQEKIISLKYVSVLDSEDKNHNEKEKFVNRFKTNQPIFSKQSLLENSQITFKSLDFDIRKKYIFTDLIGKGHFGKVRKAYEVNNPEKLYAIKSIRKKDIDKEELRKLNKEVEIMSSLHHPYIVTFHETYQDDMYFHIVMELCSGQDLLEYIKRKDYLNENEVCKIIFQVISGISYCHNAYVCHRDLKPENILLFSNNSTFEVKIIDFGLSKKLKSQSKMKTILGTPFYIAPEVLLGNYDSRCDMWSIGAITYLMLTGQPPFFGMNRKQIFYSILTKEVDITRLKNVYSKEAISFIQTCLEKNPKKRISSSDALNHKWFNKINNEIHSINNIHVNLLNRIRNFIAPNELKKLFLSFLLNNLNHKELEFLKDSFIALDQTNKGYLTLDDFEKAFEKVGSTVPLKEIRNLFEKADFESCGNLNFSEFICAVTDLKVLSNSYSKTAFKHFDFNDSGFIEIDDLQRAIISTCHNLNILPYLDDVLFEMGREKKIGLNEFKALFG